MKSGFLPADEQVFYDGVVHGLRMKGWSRAEAEAEAMDRVVAMRDRRKK